MWSHQTVILSGNRSNRLRLMFHYKEVHPWGISLVSGRQETKDRCSGPGEIIGGDGTTRKRFTGMRRMKEILSNLKMWVHVIV